MSTLFNVQLRDETVVIIFKNSIGDNHAVTLSADEALKWRREIGTALDALEADRARKRTREAEDLRRQRQQKMQELQTIIDKLRALGEEAQQIMLVGIDIGFPVSEAAE